jgi:hypothetical protein
MASPAPTAAGRIGSSLFATRAAAALASGFAHIVGTPKPSMATALMLPPVVLEDLRGVN